MDIAQATLMILNVIKFGHDKNSQNSSLNLVCPGFKRETKVGHTSSVRAARLWNAIPNSLKGNSRENYPCLFSSLWFPNGM